jgi:hypothetical protein
MVRFAKMGALYFLQYVSFATVTLVVQVTPKAGARKRPLAPYISPRFTEI